MCKRCVPVLILAVLLLAAMAQAAPQPTNKPEEARPFAYQGQTYIPLQNAAGILNAPVKWEAEKGRAVMTYNGRNLELTPNNLTAVLEGKPVQLSAPPTVVDGKTYVTAEALKKSFGIPVEWNKDKSEVLIKGEEGWKGMKAASDAPWHGGPPPWAPAYGQRRKTGTEGQAITEPGRPDDKGKGKGKDRLEAVDEDDDTGGKGKGKTDDDEDTGKGKGKGKGKGR